MAAGEERGNGGVWGMRGSVAGRGSLKARRQLAGRSEMILGHKGNGLVFN